MKMLSKDIALFDTMDEYNSYTDKKYYLPNSYTHISPDVLAEFTKEKNYIIVAIRLKPTKDNVYTLSDPIFTDNSKGFYLGPLNATREFFSQYIKSITITDNTLTITTDNVKNFHPFEIGILIDPIFDTRGYDSITTFMNMLELQ